MNVELVLEEARACVRKHLKNPHYRTRMLARDMLTILDGGDPWDGSPREPSHRAETPVSDWDRFYEDGMYKRLQNHGRHAE